MRLRRRVRVSDLEVRWLGPARDIPVLLYPTWTNARDAAHIREIVEAFSRTGADHRRRLSIGRHPAGGSA